MPSYRLRVEVGLLRPGAQPEDVLPAAEDAATTCAFVEAKEVDVSGGTAWVQLRVVVDDSSDEQEDRAARLTLTAMRAGIEDHAETGRGHILRRRAGKWIPIQPD